MIATLSSIMIGNCVNIKSALLLITFLSLDKGIVLGHLCNHYSMNMCDDYAVPSYGKRTPYDSLNINAPSHTRGCRNNLKLFVCQMIKHSCQVDSEITYLPPCREACLRLRNTCLSQHVEGSISWGELIQCEALPARSSKNCQWNNTRHSKTF